MAGAYRNCWRVGIYFLSPFLFATVFGAKWELSGELASIMSVFFYQADR